MSRPLKTISHPEAFVAGWNAYTSRRSGFNYANNPYKKLSSEADAWNAGAMACGSSEAIEHFANNPPKPPKPSLEALGGWFALGYLAGVITIILI